MTDLDTDALVRRLQQSFASHESLVDPDEAQRVAVRATSARRRWVVPAAAAAAAVLLGTSVAVGLVVHRSSPARPTSAPPGTEAHNRQVAEQLAAESLAAFPDYPGSTRIEAADAGPLRQLHTFVGASTQNSLVDSRYLLVGSGTPGGVAGWYAHHTPDGWSGGGVGGFRLDNGGWSPETDASLQDPPPEADATVDIATAATADGVVVRITTFTTWQPVRPSSSLVGDDVRSVTLSSTTSDVAADDPAVTIDDPAEVDTLTRLFDGLVAVAPADMLRGCGIGITEPAYALTFHAPVGDLDAHWSPCGGQWQVTDPAGGTATLADTDTPRAASNSLTAELARLTGAH